MKDKFLRGTKRKLSDPFNSEVTSKYIHTRLVYSSHIRIRLSFFQISLISRRINKRVERSKHLYFPILKSDGSCFLASMFMYELKSKGREREREMKSFGIECVVRLPVSVHREERVRISLCKKFKFNYRLIHGSCLPTVYRRSKRVREGGNSRMTAAFPQPHGMY